jgi:hypothetical protein
MHCVVCDGIVTWRGVEPGSDPNDKLEGAKAPAGIQHHFFIRS